MFCAITRICSAVRCLSVKRASAADVATISADDPEIPAPAGDSESVSINNPSLGAKNCNKRAAKGKRNRLARRNSSKLAKTSSLFVSSDRRWMRFPFKRVMRQVVRMFTAKFSVRAPGWNRYKGQRSIVPPARSARHGACAIIVDGNDVQDASMQSLYHGEQCTSTSSSNQVTEST